MAAMMPVALSETLHELKEQNPNAGNKFLGPHDIVGTTFFIACNMMLAFTLFFFVQVGQVVRRWKTSVSIAGLVTGVAWYNYTFMKTQWVETQQSPTTFRYVDWLITVPLQIVEFYFILSATTPVSSGLGGRLFVSSIAMVGFGWFAEINILAKTVGFALGVLCWFYIIYEVFAGEASVHAKNLKHAASVQAFSTLRLIVTFGWCIYPAGYAVTYLVPGFGDPNEAHAFEPPAELNILYNIADLVNKGAFGLCIWSAAVSDKEDALLG